MGLCQGTVPRCCPKGVPGHGATQGGPAATKAATASEKHPWGRGSGEARGWSADGSRAHAPAPAWLTLRPVLGPAQPLAALGHRGRAEQGAMSRAGAQRQELRSPLLPRQDTSLWQISSWGPSTRSNGRVRPSPARTLLLPRSCICCSASSAPLAQTPCPDLAPSSKLPVRGLRWTPAAQVRAYPDGHDLNEKRVQDRKNSSLSTCLFCIRDPWPQLCFP